MCDRPVPPEEVKSWSRPRADPRRACREDGLLARDLPVLPPQPGACSSGPGDDAAVVAAPGPARRRHHRRDGAADGTGSTSGPAPPTSAPSADPEPRRRRRHGRRRHRGRWSPSSPTRRRRLDWARGLRPGLGEAAARPGSPVAGGDLSSAPAGGRSWCRSPRWGTSRGGPRCCARRPRRATSSPSAARSAARRRAWRLLRAGGDQATDGEPGGIRAAVPGPPPASRRASGRRAARPRRRGTAMLDVSDGLLRDGGRIARASGVRLDLDAALPRAPTWRRSRRCVGEAAALRLRARRRGGAQPARDASPSVPTLPPRLACPRAAVPAQGQGDQPRRPAVPARSAAGTTSPGDGAQSSTGNDEADLP